MDEAKIVVVAGATGRQGGAVVRALLADGWRVRAMTRNADGRKARQLAARGASVVQADMADPDSLDRAFAGAYGVYSVQNSMNSGLEEEVRQGRNVGDAAERAGVRHVVYGSAGIGERGTGVGQWEAKLDVEDWLRTLDLPVTVLRPTAFMELMTDRAFYPAAGTWHIWPAITGGSVPIPWLACRDLGIIAAKVFADGERYIGQTLPLAADLRTLDECRRIYTQVFGRKPPRLPVPVWLLQRFNPDTITLWRWLKTRPVDIDTTLTRSIHSEALDVASWLQLQHASTRTGRRPAPRRH